jgi:hypothetical protein
MRSIFAPIQQSAGSLAWALSIGQAVDIISFELFWPFRTKYSTTLVEKLQKSALERRNCG